MEVNLADHKTESVDVLGDVYPVIDPEELRPKQRNPILLPASYGNLNDQEKHECDQKLLEINEKRSRLNMLDLLLYNERKKNYDEFRSLMEQINALNMNVGQMDRRKTEMLREATELKKREIDFSNKELAIHNEDQHWFNELVAFKQKYQ